jgi:hypothetical protein
MKGGNMLSGYILTEPSVNAMEVDIHGVRYSAIDMDGRGVIAFDVETPSEVMELAKLGTLLTPEPDYPDTWPDWVRGRPNGPKRGLGTGNEQFALLQSLPGMTILDVLYAVTDSAHLRGAVIVLDGDGNPGVFVEYDDDFIKPRGSKVTWSLRVSDWYDYRIPVS